MTTTATPTTVANVRDYGAVADGTTDDTTAIQNALNSKNNVYFPRGRYLISSTLLFFDAQTIYGDTKGTYGLGSQILVSTKNGGFTAFQSKNHPFLVRDVLIRDLAIWPDNLVQNGVANSVAVDFTGVGYSGLHRLSIADHEVGIKGRDSATFSTKLRADSSGKVLKIPAPYPNFARVGQDVGVSDPKNPASYTKAKIVQVLTDTNNPDYPALIVEQPLPQTYPKDSPVFPDPAGGYYNTVVECDITGCQKGVWLSHAGNAWTVLDGRIHVNDYGIYAENCDGSRFRTTFERNGVGVLFRAAAINQVMSGSYFEGNGYKDVFPGLEAYGAVCFMPGSTGNVVEPSVLSNSYDTVVDYSDGSNTCTATFMPEQPSVLSGHSSGRNVLFNADFAVDSNSDNIADGWSFTGAKPSGWTMGIDTGTAPGGASASQRWQMKAGTYTKPLVGLSRTVSVVPGQWYTFTAYTKVDAPGDNCYQMRIADDKQNYYYSTGLTKQDWADGLHRFSFKVGPTTTTLHLFLEPHNNTGTGNCTVKTDCTAWFAKFQLEPGRGLPTESRDSGLMGDVRTGGVTLDPKTSNSISVTHGYHVVQGTGTIRNIVPPEGFSGMVVLRAAGSWSAVTGGTGRGAIGNAFSMSPGRVAIGWYDGGSETWWFTVSA